VLLFNIQVLTVRTLSEFHLHLQHSTHQRCLCKKIPSHSCFTFLRGSVSAKYSPVTFDAVQLLPRSYTTVFDESKFYQPRRTAISRAAGGGGATNIKHTNFKIVYLKRTNSALQGFHPLQPLHGIHSLAVAKKLALPVGIGNVSNIQDCGFTDRFHHMPTRECTFV
jgi:hypothetical protein